MARDRIPVVILGGSDRRPARLPRRARGRHAIAGYKGVDLRIGGRPLVAELAGRLAASGEFGPVRVAGPASVYDVEEVALPVIDTDASLGENVLVAARTIERVSPGATVAFITCDILPSPEELAGLALAYRDAGAPALWFPIVRAPSSRSDLGASDWKPTYRLVPEAERSPVPVLPGHLVIGRPSVLRMRFFERLLSAGYRTRNRSIGSRRRAMVAGVLGALVGEDLRDLVSFRPPTLTWTALARALPMARELARGRAGVERIERVLGALLIRPGARGTEGIRTPVVDVLSLALDADTVEEVAGLGWDRPAGGRS